MIRNLFKRITAFVKPKKIEIDLYSFPLDTSLLPSSEHIHVVKVTSHDAALQKQHQKKIKRSTEAYLSFYQHVLAHESYVYHTSFFLSQFGYKKPLLLIGNCSTKPEFKGFGIYPFTLKHILYDLAEKHPASTALIMVDPANVASVKGIEKAGFKKTTQLTGTKMLVFVFNKKKHTY